MMHMIKPLTCPACGEHMIINTDTGIAVCGSCGETAPSDDNQLQRIMEISRRADRLIQQNTAAGYQQALHLLQEISAAAAVDEKISFCKTRLESLKIEKMRREALAKDEDRKDGSRGVVLLIVFAAIIIIPTVAGIIALTVLWRQGRLSPAAGAILLCALAAIILLYAFGKAKYGRKK